MSDNKQERLVDAFVKCLVAFDEKRWADCRMILVDEVLLLDRDCVPAFLLFRALLRNAPSVQQKGDRTDNELLKAAKLSSHDDVARGEALIKQVLEKDDVLKTCGSANMLAGLSDYHFV